MKKLFFAIAAVALISSVSSCKKCGYCEYSNGSTSSAVCKQNNPILGVLDEYEEAQTNCQAQGGKWVNKK